MLLLVGFPERVPNRYKRRCLCIDTASLDARVPCWRREGAPRCSSSCDYDCSHVCCVLRKRDESDTSVNVPEHTPHAPRAMPRLHALWLQCGAPAFPHESGTRVVHSSPCTPLRASAASFMGAGGPADMQPRPAPPGALTLTALTAEAAAKLAPPAVSAAEGHSESGTTPPLAMFAAVDSHNDAPPVVLAAVEVVSECASPAVAAACADAPNEPCEPAVSAAASQTRDDPGMVGSAVAASPIFHTPHDEQ